MQDTLTRNVHTPRSVQRCVITSGMLGYEHMEPECSFGVGNQHGALSELLKRGITRYETTIPVGGIGGRTSTIVHLIAEPDFDLDDYRVYLERMARGTLLLDAPTYFDSAVAGLQVVTRVWFDFTPKSAGHDHFHYNAVFWTVSREDADQLEAALKKLVQ